MQANVGTIPQNAAKIPEGKPKLVKMAGKLAYRNLFHDRLSLVRHAHRHRVLGGAGSRPVRIVHRSRAYDRSHGRSSRRADLWVVPLGTKSFDDPTLLIGHEKYAALSTPGRRRCRGARRRASPIGASRKAA